MRKSCQCLSFFFFEKIKSPRSYKSRENNYFSHALNRRIVITLLNGSFSAKSDPSFLKWKSWSHFHPSKTLGVIYYRGDSFNRCPFHVREKQTYEAREKKNLFLGLNLTGGEGFPSSPLRRFKYVVQS